MSENSTTSNQAGFRLDSSYFEKNSGYYTAMYDVFKSTGSAKFNWAAFLFQGWWYLYRKLYIHALIFWVLSYIPGVGLITAILSGIIANKMYFEDAESKLSKGDRSGAGVNTWVPILGIAFTVIFVVGLFFMLASMFMAGMVDALS